MTEDSTAISQDVFKRQFAEALKLLNAGEAKEAVCRLRSLLAYGQRRATLSGWIGTILLFDLDSPDLAIPYLQEAVSLSPRSKPASLNLCHALLGTGQAERAYSEARRFLSLMGFEGHCRLLAATSPAPKSGDGKPLESGAGRTEHLTASYPKGRRTDLSVGGPPRLIVVLIVETSRISSREPYTTVQFGLEEVIQRLRAAKGALERLCLYLVTFAGRIASITELKGAGAKTLNDLGTGGHSIVNLKRSGLISALDLGSEAITGALVDLRSRGLQCLRAWIVILTGQIDADHERLVAEAQRMLGPLRKDPGLNLFPIVIGGDGNSAVLAKLGEFTPLHLRNMATDAFFVWLANSLEAALQADAPAPRSLPELEAEFWRTFAEIAE